MAQQQLEYPPVLDVQDVWHFFSDDEERRERILPRVNLDISWLTIKTRQDITEAIYAITTRHLSRK